MPEERPALSLNQEFLCSLDHGETAGALSQWYTITYGLRLHGNLDSGALSAALDDVVARHEILRTALRKHDDSWQQQLHPPGPVSLEVRDAGSLLARGGTTPRTPREDMSDAAYRLLD